jgi:hypothetical protein
LTQFDSDADWDATSPHLIGWGCARVDWLIEGGQGPDLAIISRSNGQGTLTKVKMARARRSSPEMGGAGLTKGKHGLWEAGRLTGGSWRRGEVNGEAWRDGASWRGQNRSPESRPRTVEAAARRGGSVEEAWA